MALVISDPAELAGARRLLLFGGSFDPPHRAHVALPRLVRRRLEAERVVYVPAAQSPHKRDRQPRSATHRLAMLEAALAEADDAVILTLELDRARKTGRLSYTVETLEQLHAALPGTELRLLIGADQVPVFHKWYQADRITELAEPVVMLRPPETIESLLNEVPHPQRELWRRRILELPPMDVSATAVRQRLAADEPVDHLLPPGVVQYVNEKGLYRE